MREAIPYQFILTLLNTKFEFDVHVVYGGVMGVAIDIAKSAFQGNVK